MQDGIQIKFFLGIQLKPALALALEKNKSLEFNSFFQKADRQGKKYLGLWLNQDQISIDELSSYEEKILLSLQQLIPDEDINFPPLQLFAQIFLQ